MKPKTKSAKDRSTAARLRRKKRSGKKLTRKETAFLEAYERDTATWKEPAAELEEDDAGDAGDAAPIGDVPVHTAEPAVAGGGPERYTAEPVLPPAASDEPPATPPSDVAGGAAPSSSSPPPADPAAPRPLVDPPPPRGPDPELLEIGAKRFAALVAGFNTLGLNALLELFPRGSVAVMPAEVDELIRNPAGHAQAIAIIHASAYQLALQHPWLCLIAPPPSVIVLGSSTISATAIWFRYLQPLLAKINGDDDKRPAVEVGPRGAGDGAKDANDRPPATPPKQPDNVVDFAEVFE